ncbi:hypothetical protein K491DRAFT_430940 [Lophiostoma macrostomum CBS 122681]|uniref:Uncharacterized protein n=1 Tax=Lophiostoma macrostomum CBS 122681 TaxID=1314788 RepID=A0A6A6T7S3_9PLEO|nr:hypothetical protein K491DRAFT_430940 [Lophiostoma macrostomum CBS 122681]
MHASGPLCRCSIPQKYSRDASSSRQREPHDRPITAPRGGRQLERAPRARVGRVAQARGNPFELLTSCAYTRRRVVAGGCALSQLDSHIYISRWIMDRSLPCLACSATSLGGCPHEFLFAMRHSYALRPSTWPLPYLDTCLRHPPGQPLTA